MNYSDFACLVYPSGYVNDYYGGSGSVNRSYGWISPDTVWNADACFVYQNGSIYDENGHNVSDNSYGRIIDRRSRNGARMLIISARVVTFSVAMSTIPTGEKSPFTDVPFSVWLVTPYGIVDFSFNDYGVVGSYGSPDIGNDYVECHIGEEGYVFSDVWVFTEDSYGNKNS